VSWYDAAAFANKLSALWGEGGEKSNHSESSGFGFSPL